jgi:hypothetical protein
MRGQFIATLLGQVGQHEGRDADGTWNNEQRYSRETPGLEWSDGQPWCATFEAWAAHRCGMDRLWPMTASCLTAVQWWQDAGRWTQWPVLGGPFYIGPGGGTHTGVVIGWDATKITTVEGNSNPGGSANGDGVYKRTRTRSSIYGYGVPRFLEATVSADPHLDGRQAASYDQFTEDDMALTDDDVRKIVQAIFTTPLGPQYAIGDFVPTGADALNGGAYATQKAEEALLAVRDLDAKITAAGGVTGAQLAAAAQAGADAAIAKLEARLKGGA